MNELSRRLSALLLSALLVVLLTPLAYAQVEQPQQVGPPPVAQPVVREGELAVRLQQEFGLGTSEDEADAESSLSSAGIMPRNGWIADYPVTPDIISELEQSIRTAADAHKLSMERKQALDTFDGVTNELGLTIRPAVDGEAYGANPPNAENYPNPTVVNNYYTTEGPPVVTYYSPPPEFYSLYAWVPSPFWCVGFWFPGFFILHDFHRVIHVGGRVHFVSNHFNDVRIHRVFRIDPVNRFRGRTFAGIGATGRRGFISTGVPRSERRIFNAPRARMAPGGRSMSTVPRGGRIGAPPQAGGRMMAPPSGRMAPSPSAPAIRGGSVAPPPASPGRGGMGGPGFREGVRQPSGAGGGAGGGRFERR